MSLTNLISLLLTVAFSPLIVIFFFFIIEDYYMRKRKTLNKKLMAIIENVTSICSMTSLIAASVLIIINSLTTA